MHAHAMHLKGTRPLLPAGALCLGDWRHRPTQGRPYGTATDVWALGCILYELCALRRAFDGRNLGAITVRIMRCAEGVHETARQREPSA